MSVRDEMNALMDRAKEEGRLQGRAEAMAEFYGNAASVVLAQVFADAAKSAADRIRAYDPGTANMMLAASSQFSTFATAAKVQNVTPADEVTGVPVDTQISVTFEGAIDPSDVTDEHFKIGAASGGSFLNATLAFDPDTRVVTLTPENPLSPGVSYRVTVTGVRARGGQPMAADYTWTFTTEVE